MAARPPNILFLAVDDLQTDPHETIYLARRPAQAGRVAELTHRLLQQTS